MMRLNVATVGLGLVLGLLGLAPQASALEADRFGASHTEAHLAAAEGNLPLLHELADQGQDLDEPTSSGYTPLHVAVLFGQVDAAALLLSRGANLSAKTVWREDAWDLAADLTYKASRLNAVPVLARLLDHYLTRPRVDSPHRRPSDPNGFEVGNGRK